MSEYNEVGEIMNKKTIIIIGLALIAVVAVFSFIYVFHQSPSEQSKELEAVVVAIGNGQVQVRDQEHHTYTFLIDEVFAEVGDRVVIEYTGLLDEKVGVEKERILHYEKAPLMSDEDNIPTSWSDHGIFKDYYVMAYQKLKELSNDEKIDQVLLVRYPDEGGIDLLREHSFGGYVFFAKDFKDLIEKEVQDRMAALQDAARIPILTAADEEGGTVVRVSSNPNLAKEKFKSSQELYQQGGFDLIRQDTINKSAVLKNLGINLNLAPVVDVSTSPDDYMYNRSLGKDSATTATYAQTVIAASKNTGVSYTLKHFPGYGNNQDTHTGTSIDDRSYEDIKNNDLPPFKSGIDVGAEAVLVSHNIVNNIDQDHPASLSPAIHRLLTDDLKFTGITMTDDIAMDAVSDIENVAAQALLAGNDLLITTDYESSIQEIKNALQNGTLTQDALDYKVFKILAWKYYKGLLFDPK